ncbi:hypothetical protein L226DRAFT_614443 [Lentinus tigrinus ALCF2SS1-7]|uniref:Uncharacterized protein n=1 Tax=Lentinus tigrinus ALCF2SS1-6 TaxID=1328759 RepID=A0A5C2S488_9APHY|nr:hypothetical protein L227DRAFT_655006 [Lentinus tigrinus ALCF2SS1-6]RPD72861.1 hypothetical protein L226DRAFT_614443 [Lentinus tigrinus ALCF2SS1-7]
MSFPLAPSPSSHPSSGATQGRRSQPQAGARPPTFCRMDEYVLDVCPEYTPLSKEEVEGFLREEGATDETMQDYLDALNRLMETRMGPNSVGFRVIGVKPRSDDTNVYTFCLDFFDTRQRIAVNCPQGFSIHPAASSMPDVSNVPGVTIMPGASHMPGTFSTPGVFSMRGALPSWEQAFDYTAGDILPGQEKWSVPAGSHLSVVKDGRALVTFAVPLTRAQQNMMAGVVQPTLGYGR